MSLERSFLELAADLGELRQLAARASERLRAVGRDLLRHRRDLDGDSLDLIEEHVRRLLASYEAIERSVAERALDARAGPRTPELLAGLTAERRTYAERLRTLQGIAAAVVTASEWQSPSFDHSVRSTAGRQTGAVAAHVDDYRRDRHPDAASFEADYLASCVDAPDGAGLRALVTSCGMSAFTTILGFLLLERRIEGPVVIGASIYHECRDLLRALVPTPRLIEVPEAPSDLLPAAIRRHRPVAVFLDSLGNAPEALVPDVALVIDAVATSAPGATLVLDNTGLTCTFQPFGFVPDAARVRLIVFESLTKYAQFGMDRVTGGVIVAARDDAEHLDRYREHLGTNISDAGVRAIPPPDRALLARRLARLERNAVALAERIGGAAASTGRVAVTGADHPALPEHPSHEVARGLAFRGGWLSVRFAPEADVPGVHHRFTGLALEEARRRRVPLIAGASFGLDVTRIYPTAATARWGRPFVRISPGIEHAAQIERTGDILAAAVVRLAEDLHAARTAPRTLIDRALSGG